MWGSRIPTLYKRVSVNQELKDIDGRLVEPARAELPCFWEPQPDRQLAAERKDVVDWAKEASCWEFYTVGAIHGYYQISEHRWVRCFWGDDAFIYYNYDPECPFCFCKLNSYDCNDAQCILDL